MPVARCFSVRRLVARIVVGAPVHVIKLSQQSAFGPFARSIAPSSTDCHSREVHLRPNSEVLGIGRRRASCGHFNSNRSHQSHGAATRSGRVRIVWPLRIDRYPYSKYCWNGHQQQWCTPDCRSCWLGRHRADRDDYCRAAANSDLPRAPGNWLASRVLQAGVRLNFWQR